MKMKLNKQFVKGVLGIILSILFVASQLSSSVYASNVNNGISIDHLADIDEDGDSESPCEFLRTTISNELGNVGQAQFDNGDGTEVCASVQVILMIDQSSSMRTRNDQNGLRFYGPLNMVDILGKNYLLAKTSGSSMNIPLKIDLSVIHIGREGQSEYNMPLTRIAPSTEEAWEEQKEEIFSYIAPPDLEGGYLDGTDFVYAFSEAEKALNDAPQENGCPQRIIVVITDGNPDTKGYPLTGNELDAHMAQVQNIIDRSFNGPNDKVYVTAFSSDDTYWEVSGPYWENISKDSEAESPRRAKIVTSRPEIGLRLADIVQANIGEQTVKINPGPIIVPPYVQLLRLTFYPPDPSDFMELRDPYGKIVDINRSDIEVDISGEGTAIQVLELKNPTPGTYEITTSANRDDVLITMQPVFIRTEVINPTSNLLQFSSALIQLDMIDSEGGEIPLYADERYQLKLKACFMAEDGAEYPVSLVPNQAGNSLTGNYTPIDAGLMDLYVQGVAMDDSGQTWEVLKGKAGTFYIDPVTVMMQEAVGEGGCEPFQYQPFTIPLTFINQSTNEKVILNLPITWDVQATASDGTQISKAIVKEDVQNPGSYLLEMTSDQVGEINISLGASAPDPVDGDLYEFYRETIPVGINDGQSFSAAIQSITPLASKASQFLPALFTNYPGSEQDRIAITARNFFFDKKKIDVFAQLTDTEEKSLISDNREIPGLRLQNIKTEEIIETGKWQNTADGKYHISFESPKPGVYRVLPTSDPAKCGVLTSIEPLAQYLILVPGFIEQLVTVVLVLGILFGIYVLISFLLNRYLNPLRGTMGIVNSDGRIRGWYHGIDGLEGKGMWAFKMLHPSDAGGVLKIKLQSWSRGKDRVKIVITMYDNLSTRKIVKKKYECDLNHWQDINLLGECRLTWSKSVEEIMRLA